MTGFRTLMDHLNQPLDRIASPQFASELHAISQAFTAFAGGFTVTAFVIAEPRIGLILSVLGVACVLPAWLIASLGVRMAIETCLAILAIHHQIIRHAQPATQTRAPDELSGGKSIER